MPKIKIEREEKDGWSRYIAPTIPAVLTIDSIREYKKATRLYDQARIDAGIATPWEVQEENSIFPCRPKKVALSFSRVSPAFLTSKVNNRSTSALRRSKAFNAKIKSKP